MNGYDVILEGKDDKHGYFVSMVVSEKDQISAIEVCIRKAKLMDMEIVGIEEIEKLEGEFSEPSRVIEVSGKSYFTE